MLFHAYYKYFFDIRIYFSVYTQMRTIIRYNIDIRKTVVYKNMIKYYPKQIGNQDAYTVVQTDSAGHVVRSRTVLVSTYVVERSSLYYFFIIDNESRIIHPAYRFLNRECKYQSFNSRKQKANALKYLYSWLAMENYAINNLSESQVDSLIDFLKGYGINSSETERRTIRSNVTVNLYLSAIRSYFEFLGVQNKSLSRKHAVSVTVNAGSEFSATMRNERYDKNLSVNSPSDREVPKYVSPAEFQRLYSIAKSKNDRTGMIIMHLMYIYGLRLGEVLGIAVPEDIMIVQRTGKSVPVLIIRNRVSDNPDFQNAKNKRHPLSQDEYATSDYQKSKDEIVLSWDFYKSLVDYVNATQPYYAEHYPDNYEKGFADVVSQRNKPDVNHYMFLNQYGKPLSAKTWGNHLKEYFIEAGISIDLDVRQEGLSHRFRHGFAMYHARFSPHPVKDALELSKLLRHKNASTAQIYFNPTQEDEIEMKEDQLRDLYSSFPELLNDIDGKDK